MLCQKRRDGHSACRGSGWGARRNFGQAAGRQMMYAVMMCLLLLYAASALPPIRQRRSEDARHYTSLIPAYRASVAVKSRASRQEVSLRYTKVALPQQQQPPPGRYFAERYALLRYSYRTLCRAIYFERCCRARRVLPGRGTSIGPDSSALSPRRDIGSHTRLCAPNVAYSERMLDGGFSRAVHARRQAAGRIMLGISLMMIYQLRLSTQEPPTSTSSLIPCYITYRL